MGIQFLRVHKSSQMLCTLEKKNDKFTSYDASAGLAHVLYFISYRNSFTGCTDTWGQVSTAVVFLSIVGCFPFGELILVG